MGIKNDYSVVEKIIGKMRLIDSAIMENIKGFEKLMEKIGTPEFDKLLNDFGSAELLTDEERKQMQEIFTEHWEMTKTKADAVLKRSSVNRATASKCHR